MDKWLKPGIAVVISLVWTVSMIIDAITESYAVPAAVHGLMMTVAAATLGVQIMGKGND